MKRVAIFLLPGALFGAGLVVSGMTDPAKVLGFLDFSGSFDPSLACVMAGALATFALLNVLTFRRGRPLLGGELPARPRRRVAGRVLVGAVLFGVGWGLAGVCPGPAITNLGALRSEVFTEMSVFAVAMVAGMFVAQRIGGSDA